MTRVFVYEYTCAAPPASLEAGGAASLCAEGEAMLRAVLADFHAVPGVDAFTIRACDDEEAAFRAAARRADWSLVIAPEFDQILEARCRWVLEEGGRLLGPSPEAVRLCSDKLELSHHWRGRRIETPRTEPLFDFAWVRTGDRVVIKPRFGAGSQNTHLVDVDGWPSVASDLQPTLRFGCRTESTQPNPEMIVQPYVSGSPVSMAFLIGNGAAHGLLPAEQHLSNDGRFQYRGGRVPLRPDLAGRAERIASSAVATVPGLFGYVGVDVILGEDGHDWAIEINPRLTTSYVGLRELAETNLAAAMLETAKGHAPQLRWRDGLVEFAADGVVARRNR